MKVYARKAAVARTREKRIKEIFQQYVPQEVIAQVMEHDGKVPPELR